MKADPLLVDIMAIRVDFTVPDMQAVRKVATAIQKRVRRVPVEQGMRQYRDESLRIVDIIRDEDDAIRDSHFDNCLLQGPAVLFLRDQIVLEGLVFRPEMFWIVEEQRGYAGALALENVVISGSRFKDVGIAVTLEQYNAFMASMPTTYGGGDWSAHQF